MKTMFDFNNSVYTLSASNILAQNVQIFIPSHPYDALHHNILTIYTIHVWGWLLQFKI